MGSYPDRMTIFLGIFISLASVGIVALSSSESDHVPRQRAHGESQHKFPRPEIELQVPATLQSFLQDDDPAFRHTAEELRMPHSLGRFLQQSDLHSHRPTLR
jgi:hypothetical protein